MLTLVYVLTKVIVLHLLSTFKKIIVFIENYFIHNFSRYGKVKIVLFVTLKQAKRTITLESLGY